MNTLIIILRLIHIGAAVFWVGAALVNMSFLIPTVAATADAGQELLDHLMTNSRLSARVTLASYLTVLAGVGLYWIDSQGLTSAWQTSGPGVGFGLGALAALGGFGFGQVVGRNTGLLGRLASQIQGAPTPEQSAALGQARSKMISASRISTVFIIVATICMATARYWRI